MGRAIAAAALLACFAFGLAAAKVGVADVYPFATLVASKDQPLCTGALVAPRVVLTTAACAGGGGDEEPHLAYIGAFNTQLDPFKRPGKYDIQKVERVVLHPDFTEDDPRHNNLGLLILQRASSHAPVPLPSASLAYPLNASAATALGFGSLSSDGFWPQLHADRLTLLPEAECAGLQTAYGPSPAGAVDQACTALSHAFRACAAGNVGAPLLLKRGGGSSEAMVQVGVLASGFACSTDPSVASASSPALYTWLPRYADWLEEQLNRLERENGGGVDSQSVSKHDAPAAAGGAKEGGGHRS